MAHIQHGPPCCLLVANGGGGSLMILAQRKYTDYHVHAVQFLSSLLATSKKILNVELYTSPNNLCIIARCSVQMAPLSNRSVDSTEHPSVNFSYSETRPLTTQRSIPTRGVWAAGSLKVFGRIYRGLKRCVYIKRRP